MLRHYVGLLGEAPVAHAQRLFGWTPERAKRAAERLVDEGALRLDGGRLLAH